MMKNTYVLNPNDRSTTYRVTSDNIQSRGRVQVESTEPNKTHKSAQVAEKSLIKLSDWESRVTMQAEQLIRNKKAMSVEDKIIVAAARSIKEFYL